MNDEIATIEDAILKNTIILPTNNYSNYLSEVLNDSKQKRNQFFLNFVNRSRLRD